MVAASPGAAFSVYSLERKFMTSLRDGRISRRTWLRASGITMALPNTDTNRRSSCVYWVGLNRGASRSSSRSWVDGPKCDCSLWMANTLRRRCKSLKRVQCSETQPRIRFWNGCRNASSPSRPAGCRCEQWEHCPIRSCSAFRSASWAWTALPVRWRCTTSSFNRRGWCMPPPVSAAALR